MIIYIACSNILFCLLFPWLFGLLGGRTPEGQPLRSFGFTFAMMVVVLLIYLIFIMFKVFNKFRDAGYYMESPLFMNRRKGSLFITKRLENIGANGSYSLDISEVDEDGGYGADGYADEDEVEDDSCAANEDEAEKYDVNEVAGEYDIGEGVAEEGDYNADVNEDGAEDDSCDTDTEATADTSGDAIIEIVAETEAVGVAEEGDYNADANEDEAEDDSCAADEDEAEEGDYNADANEDEAEDDSCDADEDGAETGNGSCGADGDTDAGIEIVAGADGDEDLTEGLTGKMPVELPPDGFAAIYEMDLSGDMIYAADEAEPDDKDADESKKSVDSGENIDKMGISDDYPDIASMEIPELIYGAFEKVAAGELEQAAEYFVEVLGRNPSKNLEFKVVAKLSYIYREFGLIELALDILESYRSKYGDQIEKGILDEMEDLIDELKS